MKNLILISLVLLTSLNSFAGCRRLLSTIGKNGFPSHFITQDYYFKGILREDGANGGYPPQILAKSQGYIVVTDKLRSLLKGKNKEITVSIILSDDDLSERRLNYIFGRYGLKAERTDVHFGLAWSTYKVTGSSASLYHMLNNSFAREYFMWAGMKGDDHFAKKASKWFTDGEMARNESWH